MNANQKQPIPVLGIPYYNRADLLRRCIASIDYPVANLVVVDNSNGRPVPEQERHPQRPASDALEVQIAYSVPECVANIEVIRHPNAGVAGAWNEVIKFFPAPWWLISNNDIQFAPGDLEKMHLAVSREQMAGIVYGNHGASWFAITQHGVNTVGLFDENIYPAYLEDCDWSYRADLLGVRRCDCPGVRAVHGDGVLTGSCTVNANPELAAKNSRTHGGNFNYYRRKWGGLNGTEVFKTPFNDPPWPVWAWRFETETRAAQQWD